MPHDIFAPVDPPEGQRELTVGHLRKALEGLPDDMQVGPTWTEIPPDEWPGIRLDAFGIETSGTDPTDRRFCFGISAGALDDREFWGEKDDEDTQSD